jgi:ribonucleotide reductase beta subunit family protein with ferritin-like domain
VDYQQQANSKSGKRGAYLLLVVRQIFEGQRFLTGQIQFLTLKGQMSDSLKTILLIIMDGSS